MATFRSEGRAGYEPERLTTVVHVPATLPVIDLAASADSVAAALGDAYRNVGFAGIVNHGVSRAELDEVFEASRRFHALSEAEKQAIALSDHHRGFIASGTSTDTASEYEQTSSANQSESFMMLGPIPAGRLLDGPNQWPELDGFQTVIERFHDTMSDLGRRLIGHFGVALGAELEPRFEMPTAWLRLLRYPPQQAGNGYGSAPHRDYGAITVLAQDGVPGLDVMATNGDWIQVPAERDVLIVNTGEVMHRWSNGTLRRTPHRVVNRSGRERYSIPFFFDPDMRTVVEPLAACLSPGESSRFDPISFEDFVRSELQAGYEQHQS